MIKAAVIGLGWWEQAILKTLMNNKHHRAGAGRRSQRTGTDCGNAIRHRNRAALGQAPYPVSLEEMMANVRSFEAIQRSVKSGAIETI